MKNCIVKRIVIFAASLTKRIFMTIVVVVFFIATNSALYAANKGYQIPADCCTAKVGNFSWSRLGGDSLSYLLNFSFAMTKRNENASMAKYSNRTGTSAHETRRSLFSKFLIEKDCKNQAYSFILANGLYHQFAEFCSSVRVNNHHADCLFIFSNLIMED